MHRAGFTPALVDARDDRSCLGYGFGLTTVVARPSASASEVSADEYVSGGLILARKLERYRPRAVAFLGKAAHAAISGRRDAGWGRQPESFGGSVTWVLPNPSGLNRGFSLEELVAHYKALHAAL